MTSTLRYANASPIVGGACFDESGRYRYRLTRTWNADAPGVVFIMLNPSTADAQRDDPTIRRAIGFARRWRYGSLTVVNLFAWRATRVADLRRATDPVGPLNDAYILAAARRADRVVAAWGNHGAWRDRGREVAALLAPECTLFALGRTNQGLPRHPLYVAASVRLQRYRVGISHEVVAGRRREVRAT